MGSIKLRSPKNIPWLKPSFFFLNIGGAIIYALGVICFTVPNNIPPGGFTALATMIQSLTGFPVGTMSFILNIPILIWAWRDLDRDYAVSTFIVVLINSVVYDVVAWLISLIGAYYVGEPLLAAIFGGVIMGAGLSLGGITGASSGGTTTLGVLIHNRKPQFPVGQLGIIVNSIIIVISMFVYRDLSSAMYAIVCIFVYGQVMDSISLGLNSNLMIFIISGKSDEIREDILNQMHRGTTILRGAGGYHKVDQEILMTVVSKSEFQTLRKLVEAADEKAFVISTQAGEVRGNGFRHRGF